MPNILAYNICVRRRWHTMLFVGVCLLRLMTGSAVAQDIQVAASVDRQTIKLGAAFQLSVTVTGTQNVEPADLPPIEGMQVRYLGPSTRVTVVNGRYSSSTSFIYNLYPLETGQFQIPAIPFDIKGNVHKTEPFTVQVVNAQSQGSTQPQGLARSGTGERLQDKIFLVMGTPAKEAYVNEKIPVTIKLFVSNLSLESAQYPEVEHSGFLMGEYEKDRRYQQVIGGVRYTVFEFKTYVYPQRPGELRLGPARQVANVRFRSQRQSPFGGLFDENFFEGFFDSYDVRAVTLESSDLVLNAKQLPKAGQPENFSGAVGQLDFRMSVGPEEVKVGDPLTIRMHVSGEGNLRTVQLPTLQDSADFKFYEPQVSIEDGVKTVELVAIPKHSDITEFPEVSFSFFDPYTKTYETVTRGPFPVTVKALGPGEQLKVVGLKEDQKGLPPAEPEQLGEGISFIKERPGGWQPLGYRLVQRPLFWLMVVIAALVWGGLLIKYRRTLRLKTDVQFARRLRAPQEARRQLQEAEQWLQRGDERQFYDTIFKTLQVYFGNKFHIPAGNIAFAAVAEKLQAQSLGDNVRDKVRRVFEQCEEARYASVRHGQQNMQAVYRHTQEIIDTFERKWK